MSGLRPYSSDSLELATVYATALHRSGAPAHVLEGAVEDLLLASTGHSGAVMASPTALWVASGDLSRLIRVAPGGMHLGWMRELLQAVDVPDDEQVDLERVGRVAQQEPAPSRFAAVAFIIGSMAAGALLGTSLAEPVAAGLGALGVWAVQRRLQTGLVTELVAATLAATVGALAQLWSADAVVVALSAVVVSLPGLSMTVSLSELAQGHWSSGSARLAGGGGDHRGAGRGPRSRAGAGSLDSYVVDRAVAAAMGDLDGPRRGFAGLWGGAGVGPRPPVDHRGRRSGCVLLGRGARRSHRRARRFAVGGIGRQHPHPPDPHPVPGRVPARHPASGSRHGRRSHGGTAARGRCHCGGGGCRAGADRGRCACAGAPARQRPVASASAAVACE